VSLGQVQKRATHRIQFLQVFYCSRLMPFNGVLNPGRLGHPLRSLCSPLLLLLSGRDTPTPTPTHTHTHTHTHTQIDTSWGCLHLIPASFPLVASKCLIKCLIVLSSTLSCHFRLQKTKTATTIMPNLKLEKRVHFLYTVYGFHLCSIDQHSMIIF